MIDPKAVKNESEKIITAGGGQICDWLPQLDITEMRDREAIVGRALAMLGLMHIYFRAPTNIINDWISRVGATKHLSTWEQTVLARSYDELTEQELTKLYWYIECVWTLMWIGSLIDELPYDSPVYDWMAQLTPNIQQNEDGSKFSAAMRIRSFDECFRMLDIYYRIHWYTQNGQLNGYDTSPVSFDIVMERRKALEWVLDKELDWDDVPLDT